MKLDTVQLMRVSEELTKYFYLKGSRSISVSYDFGKERFVCKVHAQDLELSEEDGEYLLRVFEGPVQPEVANYYGTLAGRRRDELEMELVGTMAELVVLESSKEMGTFITVSRKAPR
jgi:hypothetical protein